MPKPDINSEQLWNKRFYLLVFLVLAWRIFYIAVAPLDLVPDESYYWDWSRHLDWGYFSKPPMVAWINALSTSLLGSYTFTVRLPAAILSCVTILSVFLLGRTIFTARVGFWAAVISLAAPGSCALGFIMSIDAPLLACWSMALYLVWLNIKKNKSISVWAVLLGLVMGLGILSKEMMFSFPFLMLLFLATTPGVRSNLARPWPYVSIIVAIAMIMPTIFWNMQNGWITAIHSASHVREASGSFFDFLIFFPEFIGLQMGVISPVTFVLFAGLAVSLIIGFRGQEPHLRFLFMFSIPALTIFTFLSFHQSISANWPAVFYCSGFILLAAWGCGELDLNSRFDKLRRFFITGVKVGVVFAVLTYAMPFLIELTGFHSEKYDPTARLRGWSELGEKMDQVMAETPEPDNTLVISADRRQVTSSLAFYMETQPRVYKWSPGSAVNSQYDLWSGPVDKKGRDALIVLRTGRKVPQKLKNNFKQVNFLQNIGKASGTEYKVYLGENLTRWN